MNARDLTNHLAALLRKERAAMADFILARPGASAEEILEAGLDLLLAHHAKRKGLVARPREAARPARRETVPAHVMRAVWTRAGGRCEWRLESGERCGCTMRLELDHILPRARGGESTLDNVRVLCRAHNDAAARAAFGDGWMDRFTRGRGGAGPVQAGSPAPSG